MRIEQRLSELGLELPPVPTPAANYANAVRTGNLVFLSGTVPSMPDGTIPKGKVGADVTTDEAVEHARRVGLTLLAVLKQEIGDLDRVRRVVKLLGMVNAVPDFLEHSRVINGCSDLFVEIFGERHARSAIGVGSLPFGITVEIEADLRGRVGKEARMPGLFDRLRGKSDDEPVDMNAISPESGLKYKDIALLGQMMQQGADLSKPRHALYYLYLGSPEAAEAAAVEGRGAGYSCAVRDLSRSTRGSGRSSASDPTRCSTSRACAGPMTCSRGSPIDSWASSTAGRRRSRTQRTKALLLHG